ncbi:hypothetical protein AVEN_79507-1 [Araneus ventricosus]|uniref:Uncharacterized protein n=1 Tax=Araneus ventricosus TaxID=182803 RepID=A0A4Y2Q716_ARAVE|nr:hypothetical protein AVEN_79507-1 [Araneus ventricosus]
MGSVPGLRLLYSKLVSKLKMPRKQAKLVPFLQNALDGAKYRNLNYEDGMKKVFSLYLPHKTNRLEMEDQYIFNDWYAETKRKYIFSKEYTNARQAMTAALRKSDYVELMCFQGNKLICRILNEEEVEERKLQKKESKRLKGKQEDGESESSIESGYESGLNSPESCMDYGQNDKNLLQGIVHDHAYVFSPLGRESSEGSYIHSDSQEVSNETILIDEATGTFGTSLPLEQDHSSGIKSNLEDTCLKEDFFNIPVLPDDVTLKDLDKISNVQLIRSNYNELQLALQVYDSIGSEANERKKLYVCKDYVLRDETLLLICKLFQDMDVEIPDTSSNIRIVLDEAVQRGIQDYSCLKKDEQVRAAVSFAEEICDDLGIIMVPSIQKKKVRAHGYPMG